MFLNFTYTIRFLCRTGLVCDGEGVVDRRISGVSIGGVPWRVGNHCLYQYGPDGVTCLGVVVNMFHGMDELMNEIIVFQVDTKPITTYMGHYCLFNNVTHDTVFVLWNLVTWKCKTLDMDGDAKMALPYVSCSSRELMEFV